MRPRPLPGVVACRLLPDPEPSELLTDLSELYPLHIGHIRKNALERSSVSLLHNLDLIKLVPLGLLHLLELALDRGKATGLLSQAFL